MHTLRIKTLHRQEFADITYEVSQLVAQSGVTEGICYLYCPHTTAGLTLNENWDSNVQHDIGLTLNAIAPQRSDFRHAEGNSPAHIKTSIVGSDHNIFINQGDLVLGRWQGIYLAEFDGPRERIVLVKIISD